MSDSQVATRRASDEPEPFDVILDRGSTPIARVSVGPSLVPVTALGDQDPVARVRREVALWSGPRMREVRDVIEQAARVDVTVLVTGETGTGKEVVARAIHYLGPRRNGPFIKVNCAAVARELLESELFGHERGAFTGAHQLKIGKFEAADGGTIFLDEIGDLHPALQGKLLHVIEDGQFPRVGGRANIKVDVRVIAATNQDLERAVLASQFREDLFYRLNVVRILMPPLRERREEILSLVNHFIGRYAKLYRREGFTLPLQTLERLLQHPFPGNVRELENMVKRMLVLGDPNLVRGELLNGDTSERDTVTTSTPAKTSLKEISRKAAMAAERDAIKKALDETRWNRVRAAKVLSISYRSLLYKIKEAGLDENGSARP